VRFGTLVALLYILYCTSYNSIHSWDIAISGLEKQTSAILEFFFRLLLRPYHSNRRAIPHQATNFRPNRATRCGVVTSYTISRWRQRWLNATSGVVFHDTTKVKIYAQTKFHRHILIHGSDTTTSVLEKQTSAIFQFFFIYDFDQITFICVLFCIKLLNFAPNRPIRGRMTLYAISRWQPRWYSTTSGFVFNVVTLFQSSKSIYKLNVVDISQITAEI